MHWKSKDGRKSKTNIAYNMDCLEAMKQMPDNAFDLAVVDPPYGDGSQVVQVEREREQHGTWNRFGGRFDRYKSTTCTVPDGGKRERERRGSTGEAGTERTNTTLVSRTGGQWAAKYTKKS